MKEITVNQRALDEVARLLSEPFPEDAFQGLSYRDDQYVKVEMFEDRLDSLIGRLNYDLRYTEPRVVTAIPGRISVIIGCSFTMYSDDREPVLTKTCYSAADVIFTEDGTPASGSMKQCIGSAQSYAFKRMVTYGLGAGIDQLRRKNADISHASKGKRSSEVMRVLLLSGFKKYDSVCKAPCVDQETGTRMDFTIFRKDFPIIENALGCPIDEFCRRAGKDTSFEFYGHCDKDRNGNDQAVFDGMLT